MEQIKSNTAAPPLRAVAGPDTVEVYAGAERYSFTSDEAAVLAAELRRALRKREPFSFRVTWRVYLLGKQIGAAQAARRLGGVR